MEKIIIRYIGEDFPQCKSGILSLQTPFNNPVYYDIVTESDIPYNAFYDKCHWLFDDVANRSFCFCEIDGKPSVFIRKGDSAYGETLIKLVSQAV